MIAINDDADDNNYCGIMCNDAPYELDIMHGMSGPQGIHMNQKRLKCNQ